MTKHPRQADLDRLVRSALNNKVASFQVVLREVDGKVEPMLIVAPGAQTPRPDEVELG